MLQRNLNIRLAKISKKKTYWLKLNEKLVD
jgi:hypothetical protein